jgi:hypothetical protein
VKFSCIETDGVKRRNLVLKRGMKPPQQVANRKSVLHIQVVRIYKPPLPRKDSTTWFGCMRSFLATKKCLAYRRVIMRIR